LRLALPRDRQLRYAVVAEEADPSPWRRLDYLPPRLALPLAVALGMGLAWAVWTLPDLLAAPLFLLLLAGGAALAFRGEPIMVTAPPAAAEPDEPARPSLVPEDWWVDIPAGRFLMGSPGGESGRSDNEGPQHEVQVSAFRCLRYPVTEALARRLDGDDKARLGANDLPLVNVSWLDAARLCNRFSEADGLRPCYRFADGDAVTWDRTADGYRLLTEAEWEYACRAGTSSRWSFGDKEARLGKHAWYDKNADGEPHPVGKKRPNPWGLHDMHGLVLEWCWDWYGLYSSKARTDPSGPSEGDYRVLRGGSFWFRAVASRSADRGRNGPGDRFVNYGFRCARAPRRQP
jgi:formylglycine-generating enzyme required for sulfatase activity